MFKLKNHAKSVERDDDDTFRRRIREAIEEKTGETSGIKVFEHADETTLDEQERQILARLREAHKNWQAKHANNEKFPQEDTFKSVRVKI